MAKLFEPEKDVPKLYNELYRKGVTKIDAIAFICFILKESYNRKSNHLEEEILNDFDYKNNKITETFLEQSDLLSTINKKNFPDKSVFKAPLRKIIIEWSEESTPDKKITPENIVKIMQSIAINLTIKVEDPEFIDLAVGTGSLLEKLPSDVYGFDVDGRLANISQNYLFFSNDSNINIQQKDSILEQVFIFNQFQTSKNSPVFLFDPPMGDSRPIPANWSGKNYSEIIGEGTKKASSEALFLTNYLLHAPVNSYFIGLFPASILFRANKDYSSLRNYLVKNSIKFIIEVSDTKSSGKIILVGSKNQNILNEFIPVVNIYNSNKDLSEFINNLVNFEGNTIIGSTKENGQIIYNDFAVIDFINRNEYLKSDTNTITTPKKLDKAEELIAPDLLIKMLEDSEKELSLEIFELRNEINIKSNEVVESIKAKDELEIWLEEKDTEISDKINFLRQSNYIVPKDASKLIYNLHFYQNDIPIFDYIDYINIFYKSKMFSEIGINYFEINFNNYQKTKKIKSDNNNFAKYFKPENFDKNIKTALGMLPDIQKEIYYKIYNSWLNKEENNNFNSSRYALAILVLKELYLIKVLDKENKNEYGIEIKNELIRPFHPVLDGGNNGI